MNSNISFSITKEERQLRLGMAADLMQQQGIATLLLEPGSSMFYFTGITWGCTERLTATLLFADGGIRYICPRFEREAFEAKVLLPGEIHCWEEHHSPFALVSSLVQGKLAVGENARFKMTEAIRNCPNAPELISDNSVEKRLREIKSKMELALMQRANDLTMEVYRRVIPRLCVGTTKDEFAEISFQEFRKLGVKGRICVDFGEGSSYPHGAPYPRPLREGDVVLMDGGCNVDGYFADISRTIIFGEATEKQRRVWNLEKEAQMAGFAAAKLGACCENVDRAARKVLTDAGYGPEYKTPGLPHRTGHGLGLDIHEEPYMVEGNKKMLKEGMCFTIEPMIVIPGEFGVRLEDDVYMTADGPRFFTTPSGTVEDIFRA